MRIRSGFNQAFTLAELLIALVILGVIATFTIPKVLVSQQNAKWNSAAKEVAGMLDGALQAYKASNTVTGNTKALDLTPYMNYLKVDATSTLDQEQGNPSFTCDGGNFYCLDLHNGGVLDTWGDDRFGDTASTSAVWFYFDPDGVYSGSATGNGKSVVFFLYPSGKIKTYGSVDNNTGSYYNGSTQYYSPVPAKDPPWFSWS